MCSKSLLSTEPQRTPGIPPIFRWSWDSCQPSVLYSVLGSPPTVSGRGHLCVVGLELELLLRAHFHLL